MNRRYFFQSAAAAAIGSRLVRAASDRLNVAVSRAQCLAILVCSPRLLEARCQSIEEMQLVNALCRLVEYAEA